MKLLFHQAKSVLTAVSQQNLLWWQVETAIMAPMGFDKITGDFKEQLNQPPAIKIGL